MTKLQRVLAIALLVGTALGVFVAVVSAEELSPPYIIAVRSWGTYANAAAVDTARSYAYIGGANGIAVYSGTQLLKSLTMASPRDIAVDPQRGYAYATMLSDVKMISATANFAVQTASIGERTEAIAVMTTTGYVYVTLPREGTAAGHVAVLGTGSSSTIEVGVNPKDIAVNPVTGYVYVVNNGSNTVSAFKGVGTDYVTIQLPPQGTGAAAPNTVVVDPATGYVYVANSNDTLTVIQGTTIQATLSVTAVSSIAVHPDTGFVYVGSNDLRDLNNPRGELKIVQGATLSEFTIPMPKDVRRLVVDPNSGYIFVSCGAGKTGSMSVVSYTTKLETFPIGTTPMDIAVDTRADMTFVPIYDGRIAIFGHTQVYATPPMDPSTPSPVTLSCPNSGLQGVLPIEITVPAGAMTTPNTRLLCIPLRNLDVTGYVWAGQAFRLLASIEPTGTRPSDYVFNHPLAVSTTYPSSLPSLMREDRLEFLRNVWMEAEGVWEWNDAEVLVKNQSLDTNQFFADLTNVGEHAVLWQVRIHLPLIVRQR
ncbi:MAG: YncE family protein [Anaerolineae bacterium]|nr:YncE family protein [Anaerolineae bacterium]